MSRGSWNRRAAAATTAIALCCTANLLGQAGTQGTVVITVTDSANSAVAGAKLELTNTSTNAVRTSKTEGKGIFSFVGLPIGKYTLSVEQPGFATTHLDSVIVEASKTTPVTVMLKVGDTSETVNVDASAVPLLDTTSNSIGAVLNLKAIENLPVFDRDLTGLATLVAGSAGGVFNGQPLVSQGVNIDGVIASPSRAKYNGNIGAAASPRIENIAEMAVQTDQIDLDQGFGSTTMQISYVTRSGTNAFHGRIYWDGRNSGLYANSWYNNNHAGTADDPKVRRPKEIRNEFGASLGGPIWRDKLFFFGSFSTLRVPSDSTNSNSYLSPDAQNGIFTYVDSGTGQTRSVNVYQLAAAVGATSTPNSIVANQISTINKALTSGTLVTNGSDPNVYSVTWNGPQDQVNYWPTARLDYNATQKLHMYLSTNMTQQTQSGAYQPPFPGSSFSNQISDFGTRSFTAGYGADYQLTSKVINQLKLGYLYSYAIFGENAPPLYAQFPSIYWGLGSSGQSYGGPISYFYPVLNISDTISWQKGNHSLKFGGMWAQEQDHYYNGPAGFPNYYLGLATGDPAIGGFNSNTMPGAPQGKISEAMNLYATLTGRISGVSGQYAYSPKSKQYLKGIGDYSLDELQRQWGLYFQDSWRFKPTLTLNYGLRWDFIGDNYDLTNAYHSVTEANIYGPSSQLFTPGALGGNPNPTVDTIQHSYNPYNVTPQPQVGFAWNPSGDSMFGKLLGKGDTVVRGGFGLKRFTMPQQYYWNNASSYGSFFYQNFSLTASNTGAPGTFAPGSLSLGSQLPAYYLSPSTFVQSEALSDFTYLGGLNAVGGMDKHIKQPYTESWSLGVERKLGKRALEVRYVGNRTLHIWTPLDINEVNVFENGFLQDFKNAKANLAASGGTTFKGALPTKIFDAAFSDEAAGQYGNLADYDNGQFTTAIQNGSVGYVASVLASVYGTTSYFCNLVGQGFSPCGNNIGYTGGGAGYPINFFQANPYSGGGQTSLMKAAGYSNYNSLQVDLRQPEWHGWVYDLNYTFGKNLGVSSAYNYTGASGAIRTLRNLSLGYAPLSTDRKHVMHLVSTYDLPIGKGRAFLSGNGWLSRAIGNWNVGTIVTLESGGLNQLYGGNQTFNDYTDGGVVLTGVTPKQLQQSIKVHRVPGTTFATMIDPKYLASANGITGVNTQYINANTTPGVLARNLFLYGPKEFYQDVSLTKSVPLYDRFQFRLQGIFSNAWNHPVWTGFDSGVQDQTFGTGYVSSTARRIEIRANLEF